MSRFDWDPRKNQSGCSDPTPYEVIKHDYKHKKEDVDTEYTKFSKLILSINKIIEKAGFRLEGQIVLRSKKNGRVFR